jgi:hypothetical protein
MGYALQLDDGGSAMLIGEGAVGDRYRWFI